MPPISGHVFRFEGKRRPTWRAKYRLPDGRRVKKTIGPAWTERGRPPAGYYTKRNAEAWLGDVLAQARAGTLPGMVRTGVTFADACDEYLRYVEVDLDRKPSTVVDYRSIIRAHLLPEFGVLRLEGLTAERIEAWVNPRRRQPHEGEDPHGPDWRPQASTAGPQARLQPDERIRWQASISASRGSERRNR